MSNEGELLAMLKSPKASVRYDATELLRVQSSISPAALESLEQALQDPDSSVRESAASALHVHKPTQDQSLNEQNSVVEAEGRKRGGCLTAWIILGLISTPLALCNLLPGSGSRPYLADWEILLTVIRTIAYFISFMAIWRWKRWGVYAYFGISIISFVVYLITIFLNRSFYVGLSFNLFLILIQVIGWVWFALLIRPIWHQMD